MKAEDVSFPLDLYFHSKEINYAPEISAGGILQLLVTYKKIDIDNLNRLVKKGIKDGILKVKNRQIVGIEE